jgi:type II secretory pathway pseudopilin PulG
MKKAFGVSAVLAVFAVLGFAMSIALAAPLSNPGEAANCATTTGTWHFVHVQTSATSGTITVDFSGSGDGTYPNTPSSSSNLHYHVTGSGTLLNAFDSVSGGKLVLSDCPVVTTTTTTTVTTTTDTTTTTTAP